MMIPSVLPRFANASEAALWAWYNLAINVQPMSGQIGSKLLTPYYTLKQEDDSQTFTAGFALKLTRDVNVLEGIQPLSTTMQTFNWPSLGASYSIPTRPAWVDSFEKLCAWIISSQPNCHIDFVNPTLLVLKLRIDMSNLVETPALDDSTLINDAFVFTD